MTIEQLIEQRSRALGIVRSCAVGLVIFGAAACSDEEPARSASTEMQPAAFTFAPPDGTTAVRTDHRRYEVSLVGTPLRNLEEEELRWNVSAKRVGDGYTVQQELTHATMKHDGETLIDQDVKPGAVTAQLIIDRTGNLVEVRGLQGSVKSLKAPASAEQAPAAERLFINQNLKALIATRYEETLGDIIGRPTKVGSSWTTAGRPDGAVTSRTVKVAPMEPCGEVMCARLDATYQLNPKAMVTLADGVVRDFAKLSGRAPSALSVQEATYTMAGMLLTEPATMVNHAASLDETGKVVFSGGPSGPMEIDLQGKVEISYEFAKPAAFVPPEPAAAPVAEHP
jgi:hypothetical protein